MSTSKSLLFVLFILAAAATATTTTALSSSASQKSTLFIKNSCNSTSFPSLCYSSLSIFASSIKQSPFQLTQVAATLSLSSLRSAASTASTCYNQSLSKVPVNSRTVKALKDCKDLLGDAADNTNYSISELKSLRKGGVSGSQKVWQLSNVQTYMSAALTKEDTCIDGLKEMGAVVKQVSGKVKSAEKYTSNALGLVNSLRYSYQ